MTTPLQIDILIHYYTCAGDYRDLDAPAIKDAVEGFYALGLLFKNTKNGQKYEANFEALKPYIEALRSVPLPTQKWVV